MPQRKVPDWMNVLMGKSNPGVKDQITITKRAQPGAPVPPTPLGQNAEYTGTGNNGVVEPNKPVDILQTNRGPRVIHEAEVKVMGPGNRMTVIPANQLNQEVLTQIEHNSKPIGKDGITGAQPIQQEKPSGQASMDGYKAKPQNPMPKVPGYMGGTQQQMPGYLYGTQQPIAGYKCGTNKIPGYKAGTIPDLIKTERKGWLEDITKKDEPKDTARNTATNITPSTVKTGRKGWLEDITKKDEPKDTARNTATNIIPSTVKTERKGWLEHLGVTGKRTAQADIGTPKPISPTVNLDAEKFKQEAAADAKARADAEAFRAEAAADKVGREATYVTEIDKIWNDWKAEGEDPAYKEKLSQMIQLSRDGKHEEALAVGREIEDAKRFKAEAAADKAPSEVVERTGEAAVPPPHGEGTIATPSFGEEDRTPIDEEAETTEKFEKTKQDAYDKITQIMEGASETDKTIMNRYLTEMRAGNFVERKAMMAQLSADPNLTDAAKRAAMLELQQVQRGEENKMLSDLAINSMNRAESAAEKIYGWAEARDQYEDSEKWNQWEAAMSADQYDQASKIWEDMTGEPMDVEDMKAMHSMDIDKTKISAVDYYASLNVPYDELPNYLKETVSPGAYGNVQQTTAFGQTTYNRQMDAAEFMLENKDYEGAGKLLEDAWPWATDIDFTTVVRDYNADYLIQVKDEMLSESVPWDNIPDPQKKLWMETLGWDEATTKSFYENNHVSNIDQMYYDLDNTKWYQDLQESDPEKAEDIRATLDYVVMGEGKVQHRKQYPVMSDTGDIVKVFDNVVEAREYAAKHGYKPGTEAVRVTYVQDPEGNYHSQYGVMSSTGEMTTTNLEAKLAEWKITGASQERLDQWMSENDNKLPESAAEWNKWNNKTVDTSILRDWIDDPENSEKPSQAQMDMFTSIVKKEPNEWTEEETAQMQAIGFTKDDIGEGFSISGATNPQGWESKTHGYTVHQEANTGVYQDTGDPNNDKSINTFNGEMLKWVNDNAGKAVDIDGKTYIIDADKPMENRVLHSFSVGDNWDYNFKVEADTVNAVDVSTGKPVSISFGLSGSAKTHKRGKSGGAGTSKDWTHLSGIQVQPR